jgi:hypothetical protein
MSVDREHGPVQCEGILWEQLSLTFSSYQHETSISMSLKAQIALQYLSMYSKTA